MTRLLLILSLASLACSLPNLVAENRPLAAESGQTPTEKPVPTADILTVIVTANKALNVRTGPAVTYPTTSFYLLAGWRVEIVSECVGGWVKIEYSGMTGWVNADFLNDGSVCQ